MREYLNLFLCDHTHDEPTTCVGNPSLVTLEIVESFLARDEIYNVNRDDPNNLSADMKDEEGVKHFFFKRVLEDDDALTTEQRIDWNPEHANYKLSVAPNWDEIPAYVKDDEEQIAQLNAIQGEIEDGETVKRMLDTVPVINVKVTALGVVSGYDLESMSTYTYTPVLPN